MELLVEPYLFLRHGPAQPLKGSVRITHPGIDVRHTTQGYPLDEGGR